MMHFDLFNKKGASKVERIRMPPKGRNFVANKGQYLFCAFFINAITWHFSIFSWQSRRENHEKKDLTPIWEEED